jgi:hypothetical protein
VYTKVHLETQNTTKKTQKHKAILSKKSNGGDITIPDLKLQRHSNKNNMVMVKKKNQTDMKNSETEIEDPNLNPHSYTNIILTKVPKTYDGEKTVSSKNVVGKAEYLHVEN